MVSLLRPWTWPTRCVLCDAWPSPALCADCRDTHARILPRCQRCALPVAPGLETCLACRERSQHALDTCLARLDYEAPWDRVLAQFKFQQQPGWARSLAGLMLEDPRALAPLAQATRLCPIPLPPQRLRERGYNQAWALLQGLCGHGTGQALPDLLQRRDDTPLQHRLDRRERQRNADRAFNLNPKHAGSVTGQHVLVVDDVMTTGATLEAAARVLRHAGALTVSAWVLARTPTPQPME